jgi:hypothetical protein
MFSCDHVIASAAKDGLREIQFLPRNSLQSSSYAFGDIVVLIASHSRKIKTQACYAPTMRRDHRSQDLDDAPELTDQISPFKFYG